MPEVLRASDSILVKRYAGKRLYNTADLAYLTLQDLAEMMLVGRRFVVRDAVTGDDVTGEILDRLH